MMKKVFLGVLAIVAALSLGTTSALAAGPGAGCTYKDADGDGICDNCGTYHRYRTGSNGRGCNFVDADGDGVCDNYVAGQPRGRGCGKNFTDADGDGVCDNYVASQPRGNGQGKGSRGRRGR